MPGNSRPKLKPDAVPSKFDFPSQMCKPSPKKRSSRNSTASSSNVNINVTEVNKRGDSHDKIVQVDYLKTVLEKETSDEKLKIFNNRKGGKRLKLMHLIAQLRL